MTLYADFEDLRTTVRGEVCRPEDPGYDDARRVWNAQIDRRPAVIVFCTDAADVSAAILYARRQGLGISVRGGAHNTSGSAVADDELMINLARMNTVTVDPEARRARVGGGALLGDMDAATQAHGLASTGGVVSHTGVGGLTLGGGMGWLSRMHGLAIDNLVGAEIVLADGSVVLTDADHHPDLFWALRGGGGNFGVVTTFEFRLHPVGPMVTFGMFFWGLDQGADALRAIREVAASLPREFGLVLGGLNAPPAPFVPDEYKFAPGIAAMLTGFGSPEAHAEQAARLRAILPPAFELITPIPYAALQQMQDEGTRWGQFVYEKGTALPELGDEVIDVLVAQVGARTAPTSLVMLYLLDEAYSEVPEDATAYGSTRVPRYEATIVALTEDMDGWAAERDWVRGAWDALQPYALGIGGYLNSMAEFEDDRIKASYGAEKYARLARVKGIYDPQNVFRCNVNIPPAG